MKVVVEDRTLRLDRVTVIRLCGELSVATAPLVRGAVLKAIAGQPAMIVIEASELTVENDIALTLFPTVARHAAAWPGISVVLAGSPQPLKAALERMAISRSTPLFPTVEAACQADRPMPRRVVERLLATPSGVREARAVTVEACRRLGGPGMADLAELIMSELMSNAVRHVGGSVELSLCLGRRHLHLSVHDSTTELPRLGGAGGRGLMVVEALTAAWGTTLVPDGKVVWATLRRP
jgi:anti-anti-sigma regulatory factor